MISQNAAGPGDVGYKRESAVLILVHCICCLVPTYLFNLIFFIDTHKNTFAPNNVKNSNIVKMTQCADACHETRGPDFVFSTHSGGSLCP